jgi:hypothetical protein
LFQRVRSELEGRRDLDLSGCGDLFVSECCFDTCREIGRRVRLDWPGVMDPSVAGLVLIMGMALRPIRDALRLPQATSPAEFLETRIQGLATVFCEKALPGLLGPEASRQCMRQ